MTITKMRFHDSTDNTGNYLKGANNYPYSKPPKLGNDYIPMSWEDDIGWDDVPEKFIKLDIDDAAKCFCCSGWFPLDSCVVNHDEEHKAVPVCETCADGRVG
tara:strand:- start:565 stop:870 length:306 start_codon:yes stop_codon:yes gene_type:complete